MGLTSWKGAAVRKGDVTVAKNYLGEEEITALNRIVTMFLDYAEDQAERRKQIFLRDWREKLDEFLKISGRKLLDHADTVSAEAARAKAEREYERYRVLVDAQPRGVDADFEKVVKELEKLPAPSRKKKKS